jgi:ComF family protein
VTSWRSERSVRLQALFVNVVNDDHKVVIEMPGHLLQKVNQVILDLIFPPHCVNCKSANSWFCQNCLSRVSFIGPNICQRCGAPASSTRSTTCTYCQKQPLHAIDGIRAVSIFEDSPIRPAIHVLKYQNHQAVAAILAGLLADAYRRYALAVDLIVPVPLHAARLKERGYNQSELLAGQLSQLVQLPVDAAALQRIKRTEAQVGLGANERQKNVAGAFAAKKSIVDQKILLIDDVCTTGSTLDACATALKAAGAASVWGLTLARAC